MDFEKYYRDEYIDYKVYSYLAKLERNKERKAILEKFAKLEYEHFLFWKSMIKKRERGSLDKLKISLIILFKYIFGFFFF